MVESVINAFKVALVAAILVPIIFGFTQAANVTGSAQVALLAIPTIVVVVALLSVLASLSGHGKR